jgi:hypothetical protein
MYSMRWTMMASNPERTTAETSAYHQGWVEGHDTAIRRIKWRGTALAHAVEAKRTGAADRPVLALAREYLAFLTGTESTDGT